MISFSSMRSSFSENICQRTYKRTITDRKDYNFDSHPQSVAVGYLNNDSLLDFVVACTDNHTIEIFLGYDKETFKYQRKYSTGYRSYPRSVAIGNFDNVNGVDIAVANYGTNSIAIFLGLNDGNLIWERSFSTGSSHPSFLAVADFNNDNRFDIAVINYGTDSVSIFIGFGNGIFQFFQRHSTGYDSFPASFAIGDFNNDNQLDIVVANSGTNNIGIFFGHGNGTFSNQMIHYIGSNSNPLSVIVVDFNRDNQSDIIVANSGWGDIVVIFGYGNGSFTEQISYSIGPDSHPERIGMGYLNEDNELDLIVTDSTNEMVYVLLGFENGIFALLSNYITEPGSSPFSVVVNDLNNDNRSDALIINSNGNNVLTLIGYERKNSLLYRKIPLEDDFNPSSIATGDLNNDTFLDIVVADNNNNYVSVLLGYADGTFLFSGTFSTGNYTKGAYIVLVDLNNDDQLDLAIVNEGSNHLRILLGNGNGTFSTAMTYFTEYGWSPISLSAADVNNDHCLDLVFLDNNPDILGIFFGYCNGTFLMALSYRIGYDWRPFSIAFDDFNNDNRLDLVIGYMRRDVIRVCLGNDNGTFPIFTLYSTDSGEVFSFVTSADLNNDNHSDIVITLMVNNMIGIFFGDGRGNFDSLRKYSLRSCRGPTSLIVRDFNNDNQFDIAIGCIFSDTIVILFGDNNQNFPTQSTYSAEGRSVLIFMTPGDFNSDGLLDIALVHFGDQSVGILTNYYQADFAMQRKYSTGSGSRPSSLAVADLNNDNILDIVVINSGNKNIGIRLGIGNGFFGVETIYSTGPNSLPQSVNVADLNKDNQLDIVIIDSQSDSINIFFGYGNGMFSNALIYPMENGSNATAMTIGYLNNDQWVDLIFTEPNMNRLGILYGYNYSDFHFQQTYFTGKNSFPFGICVDDLNNDHRLDIIIANRKSDSVGIFLGYGNGTFEAQRIYSTGNQSSPSAISLADFNGDGYLDIAVGNVMTECIGILLGYGNGSFASLVTYPLEVNFSPLAIDVGDVNNDDLLDIVVVDYDSGSIGVFLGIGNGRFSSMSMYTTDVNSKPMSMGLGDVNNDNCLDIVICNYGTNSVTILLGNGNGSFTFLITYFLENQSSLFSIALGDFNNDDKLDIAVANAIHKYIGVFLGFGNGSFSRPNRYYFDLFTQPGPITVGFFNDDNYADIAVVCSQNSAVAFLFGTGDGKFLMGRIYPTSSESLVKSIAYGDFNNDTRLDFVVSNAQDDNIDVYLSNGNLPFGHIEYIFTDLDFQPQSLVVGDLNNDNQSDIVIINDEINSIGIILQYSTDDYSVIMRYPTGNGSHPSAIALGDFNDDHLLDIVITNSGTNDVITFQGFGNGSFQIIGSYSTGTDSFPCAILVNDFNNDKRLDVIVANYDANDVFLLFGLGNGTFTNATSYVMDYNSRPLAIAAGDFNNDSWIDLAVANYQANYVEILLQTC